MMMETNLEQTAELGSVVRGWQGIVILAFLETPHPPEMMTPGRQRSRECEWDPRVP